MLVLQRAQFVRREPLACIEHFEADDVAVFVQVSGYAFFYINAVVPARGVTLCIAHRLQDRK